MFKCVARAQAPYGETVETELDLADISNFEELQAGSTVYLADHSRTSFWKFVKALLHSFRKAEEVKYN